MIVFMLQTTHDEEATLNVYFYSDVCTTSQADTRVIRSIYVGVSGKLSRWFLNDFEEAFLQLRPIPTLTLDVKNASSTLRNVLNGTVLSRLDTQGRLTLQNGLLGRRITTRDVFSVPTKYVVGGKVVSLSPVDRFRLLLCDTRREREAFLKEVALVYARSNKMFGTQ